MSIDQPEIRRGKTSIAPDVLLTVARLSALGTPGVTRTSPVPGGVNRLFKRGANDGVRIEVRDDAVTVDLYLVIEHERNVREVGRAVQAAVARAIQEIVGMAVVAVNIHVEDIAYPEQEAQ
ncbi:MAG: Asp23/Gls24 family envelope stress response protein [Anaerolineales bacterium]|nr:Asp23/Gls24 family envelope stress response protein [Anaerolineales bacterium]